MVNTHILGHTSPVVPISLASRGYPPSHIITIL